MYLALEFSRHSRRSPLAVAFALLRVGTLANKALLPACCDGMAIKIEAYFTRVPSCGLGSACLTHALQSVSPVVHDLAAGQISRVR